MSDELLSDAIDRAERALSRLERVAGSLGDRRSREEQLRSTVRGVVAELDSMLTAGGR